MDAEILAWVARATGAARVAGRERIQSLWSGYGELVRIHLEGAAASSVVLKWVKPPPSRAGSVSHARKCGSYDVELAFYRSFASRCGAACRVPGLVDAARTEGQWLLLLEDLDAAGFPRRRRDPRGHELEACLAWLAAFHARFLHAAPRGLWPIGTYWHLDTRREELAVTRDARLREAAPELDRRLREARFQTIVHGDAKPANYCFSDDGRRVAAVDFQYVGGGPGVRDVAYLLHGVPAAAEARAIDLYFAHLGDALGDDADAEAVAAEWRALYDVAADDFLRFLAGWRG